MKVLDMIKARTPVIAVLALLTPGLALADPQTACSIDASSQIEIGNCLTEADRIANATVALALDFATTAAKELGETTGRASALPALNVGQAGWVAYRDQHCDFVGATYGGGSGTGIAIKSCRIALARARTDDLMRYTQ